MYSNNYQPETPAGTEKGTKMAYEFSTKLQGSEKQVAWAEDTRKNVIAYYDEKFTHLIEVHDDDEAKMEKYAKAKEAMRETAESIDSAKWWIDHRQPLAIGLGGGYADISKMAIARHPELEKVAVIRKAEKFSRIK